MDLIQPAFCNDFSYQGFETFFVVLKNYFSHRLLISCSKHNSNNSNNNYACTFSGNVLL